jgi:hypothetical protein
MVVYIADYLQPMLGDRYITAVEERVFVEGPGREVSPDVSVREDRPRNDGGVALAVVEAEAPILVQIPTLEVHESYIAILDRKSGQEVVTVIELVSPTNKYAGPGRDSYLDKQQEVLSSRTHLVEIDLLRAGPHVLAVPERLVRRPYDYLISVNRAKGRRDWFEIYPRTLRDRLPRFRIPLAGDDPDVVLDMQAVLAQTYEAGRFRNRPDYDAPCVPPLSPDDQAWADRLIREALHAGA